MRMGGELGRVEVVPLVQGDVEGVLRAFDTFDVQRAKCFCADDKGKLLGAVEAAFGTHAAFNAAMRSVLRAQAPQRPRTRRGYTLSLVSVTAWRRSRTSSRCSDSEASMEASASKSAHGGPQDVPQEGEREEAV